MTESLGVKEPLNTLPETDSGTHSDSKPDDYIVQCRTFHIVQTWIWIPTACIGQESES